MFRTHTIELCDMSTYAMYRLLYECSLYIASTALLTAGLVYAAH
jgi:hypothetical protein